MRFLLILVSTLFIQAASANVFDLSLWTADAKLQKEEYSVAVNDYLKIQAKDPRNERLNYNLGIGLYRLGAFDNAAFNFEQSAKQASSPLLKEKALYNLGNSLFKQEDYENAIKAYEAALQIDPNDEDTKFNLELARRKLDQKNQDQSDEQNKDKQDQNKDQENKDKQDQNKDQQNKNENKDKQEQKQDQQNGQNNDPKKSEPKERKGNLSEQEVQMLLQQAQEGKPQGGMLGLKSKQNSEPKAKGKPW
jgi:tetratricopeptide (TPR) repeat protein